MKRRTKAGLWVSACLVILAVLLFVAPLLVYNSPEWKGLRCNNMLRQIDAAKAQTAQVLGLTNGQTTTVEQIAPYIKGGCPTGCDAGGTYTINPVGQDPTCSLADPHATGEKSWWHNVPSP